MARRRAKMPGEFESIARFFAPLARHPGAFGLKDDLAWLTPRAGRRLVLKTDAVVVGVHTMSNDDPVLIARKALRVNLSDLAGKGAAPLGYLLALALPRETAEQQEEIADWDEFAARLGNWSAMVGISGSYRVGEGRAKDSKLAYFWARVFETRYPVLPGANPATQRVLSARIGSELDEATKVEIEAEVVQWKPVGFAELKGHCGRIRCPKTLRR